MQKLCQLYKHSLVTRITALKVLKQTVLRLIDR